VYVFEALQMLSGEGLAAGCQQQFHAYLCLSELKELLIHGRRLLQTTSVAEYLLSHMCDPHE